MVRPFDSKLQNFGECFNRGMILVIHTLLVGFTELNENPFIKIYSGWAVILLFLITALVNWALVIFKAFFIIRDKIKTCQANRKIKKHEVQDLTTAEAKTEAIISIINNPRKHSSKGLAKLHSHKTKEAVLNSTTDQLLSKLK